MIDLHIASIVCSVLRPDSSDHVRDEQVILTKLLSWFGIVRRFVETSLKFDLTAFGYPVHLTQFI